MQVADIMVTKPVCLFPDHSLKDAHDATRARGIRHLPVVRADTGELVAVVTQKAMIAKVMGLVALYGKDDLVEHEQGTNILEVAEQDFKCVKASDDLLSVAEYFVSNKHGCLPVVDNNQKIVGIITSSDFVKLSIRLLHKLEI